jgi:hypothetical protein
MNGNDRGSLPGERMPHFRGTHFRFANHRFAISWVGNLKADVRNGTVVAAPAPARLKR